MQPNINPFRPVDEAEGRQLRGTKLDNVCFHVSKFVDKNRGVLFVATVMLVYLILIGFIVSHRPSANIVVCKTDWNETSLN